MGNKCSTKTANPLLDNDLNDYDRAVFNIKREKVFYGTIAICVLYGSFALLLFILGFFSDKIKYLLLNSFLPFTIVYIIGTILIILYLVGQVMSFKPYKLNKDGHYDNLSCPDYWVLEKVYKDSDYNNNTDSIRSLYGSSFESNVVNNNLFTYRCVLNDKIFDKYDIFKASSNINASDGTYAGKYHFFNVASNQFNTVSIFDSNNDIISDKKVLDNNADYPNKLYANIYRTNDNTSNNINTNIFKNDKSLKLNYEIAKAALLMNNYVILNATNTSEGIDSSIDYTDFYKVYNNELEYRSAIPILAKLGIYLTNFDYKHVGTLASSSSTDIKHNYNDVIRVYKDSGQARICKLSSSTSDVNGKITGTVNCSTTHSGSEGGNDGYKANVLPLNCENLYPMYLASVDQKINRKNKNMDTNVIRCAYSKICGIPWSDMNCDKYDNN
jgi:hypothetical protein